MEDRVVSLGDLVNHEKPLRTGATAVYPYSKALADKYRFRGRFDDEDVLLHRVDGKYIHLPRGLCPVGEIDMRTDGEAVVFPKAPIPRDYQVELFKEVGELCKQRLSGVVVAMTGWGKTALGFHAAYTMQRKTLVITTKEDIYDQWRERAELFLGLKPHEIGEIRGDKCEVIGTKFCVALIQSMSKADKYPDWIAEGFGLVIFDECHRVPATQFSAVADMFPAKMRLGLSATPKRADGKEKLLFAHIGPIRATASVEQLVPKVLVFASPWTCPRTVKRDKTTGKLTRPQVPHMAGKTVHIEKTIATNKARNSLVASLIKTAYEKGRSIVVFTSLHVHVEAIKKACVAECSIPIKDIGVYVGSKNKAEKEQREKDTKKPIVLTTYKMCGEGTDFPWLDTCILAMPLSNVAQPVGRIRRQFENKRHLIVMDIVDDDSHVFAKYAANRRKWYESIKAEVLEVE